MKKLVTRQLFSFFFGGLKQKGFNYIYICLDSRTLLYFQNLCFFKVWCLGQPVSVSKSEVSCHGWFVLHFGKHEMIKGQLRKFPKKVHGPFRVFLNFVYEFTSLRFAPRRNVTLESCVFLGNSNPTFQKLIILPEFELQILQNWSSRRKVFRVCNSTQNFPSDPKSKHMDLWTNSSESSADRLNSPMSFSLMIRCYLWSHNVQQTQNQQFQLIRLDGNQPTALLFSPFKILQVTILIVETFIVLRFSVSLSYYKKKAAAGDR